MRHGLDRPLAIQPCFYTINWTVLCGLVLLGLSFVCSVTLVLSQRYAAGCSILKFRLNRGLTVQGDYGPTKAHGARKEGRAMSHLFCWSLRACP